MTVGLLLLVAAAVIVGAWQLGSSLAPTSADAQRARDAAYGDAYQQAREDAQASAYTDAWSASYATGAAAGRADGAAAGRAQAARTAPTTE
jgi:hypothetical protein